VLAVSLLASRAHAAPLIPQVPKQRATPHRPETFGVVDYTVSSISDLAFTPYDSATTYSTDLITLFRWVTSSGGAMLAGAEIPAGAVIDWIGLGTCDTVGGQFSVALYETDSGGSSQPIGEFQNSGHPPGAACSVDYNASPLGYQILYNAGRTIQVFVLQYPSAPTDGSALFSGVEIWWRRTVSPAPAVATFNDVPTGHPFFQFIEALAASGITAGCGNGNYCPDAPLTRGQMAVFLSKALGLQWSGQLPQ
jgi:hypothetical protein